MIIQEVKNKRKTICYIDYDLNNKIYKVVVTTKINVFLYKTLEEAELKVASVIEKRKIRNIFDIFFKKILKIISFNYII